MILSFLKIFYLFERERAYEQGKGVEGDADSPWSGDPDKGLDPRTLGSPSEPKAISRMSPAGAPINES